MSLPEKLVVVGAFNQYRRGDVIISKKEIEDVISKFSRYVNAVPSESTKSNIVKEDK